MTWITKNAGTGMTGMLQSAIYLAYIYALNKYTAIKEMTTGKGRMTASGSQFCADRSGSVDFADVVFIPISDNIPAMVIELKHNKSADSALDQIKERKYFASMQHYTGDLLLVGISYDEKTKEHECRIERMKKGVC